MGDVADQTLDRLAPILRRGDLAECERAVVEAIRAGPPSPFHVVLDLKILTPPGEAAVHFDSFFGAEATRMVIAAGYAELTPLDVHPDGWDCSLFAYEVDGGRDDLDWLSDFESDDSPDFRIRGFEVLQDAYSSDLARGNAYEDAASLADVLVAVRFQQFVRDAALLTESPQRFALYAGVHDLNDFVAAVRPRE